MMKLSSLLSMAALSMACVFPAAHAQTAPPQVGLLVPAYFDAGADQTDWNRLAIAASQVPLIAVMNPNNGPGASPDSNFLAANIAVDQAGGSTIGYVYTSYGKRSLAKVEQDVANYFAWYQPDGIFIDEMPSKATKTNLKYYAQLAQYIRTLYPQAIIVANPGTAFDQAFATAHVADIFIDQENPASVVNATPQASWASGQPASQFAEIAYASANDAQEVTTLSSRNLAWVYSTTLGANNTNPYGALPADFENEVSALVTVNGAR